VNITQLLPRRQHTDPTAAQLREQHREAALQLHEGRTRLAALEARGEQLRARRGDLRDADPAHTDLPDVDLEVQQVETELADLQAQQRFRERNVGALDNAIRIAESREAPALQAERSTRHTELRRTLPDKLRIVLADVEALTQLQADMKTTHDAYGVQSTADVLPLGSVLDRLRETLGGAADELVRYELEAAAMKENLESTGLARRVSGAYWVEG
jgi:hypothetical protein